MRNTKWLAAALGAAVSTVALPSLAEKPATANSIQLGLGFRYGLELNEGDANPWGSGIGLEAGYTLPLVYLYVGGNAEYFFGNTSNLAGGNFDTNLWQVTAEVGYDFGLGSKRLVLRPKLGLGYANLIGNACLDAFGCNKAHDNYFVVAPGAKLMLFIPFFELSFDARYEVLSSDPLAKGAIFSVGIGF